MGSAVPAGERRRKQLRSAVYTVRNRRPAPHRRDGEPELLALVEEPYAGVGEAHRRLQELRAAFESRNDRRAVFLSIYTEMTGAVTERIQEERFGDPEWVGEYLVAFANLYRKAVRDYEFQDALLGVNAHISRPVPRRRRTPPAQSSRGRSCGGRRRLTGCWLPLYLNVPPERTNNYPCA